MPASYTVELSVGEETRRTTLEVRPDPDLPVPASERLARYEFTLALYALQKRGYEEGVAAYDAGDYATALPLLLEAAEKKNPDAQYKLGAMYINGFGVVKDPGRALELFQRGCEGGDAQGCHNLAVYRRDGIGGAKDFEGAIAAFGQGCERGFDPAFGCGNLYLPAQTGGAVLHLPNTAFH